MTQDPDASGRRCVRVGWGFLVMMDCCMITQMMMMQVVMLSATFADSVRQLARQLAPNANKIVVKKEDLAVKAIKQMYIDCGDEENKFNVLSDIYGALNCGQSVVFVET